MFKLLPLLLSALALVPHLVNAAAVTAATDAIPDSASHLALDEENGVIHAYHQDGTHLGTYPVQSKFAAAPAAPEIGGKCTSLKAEEVRTLSGWSKLENYAKNNFGTGSYNLVTNPPEYLDRPATTCVSSGVIKVTVQGQPVCNTIQASTGGTINGADGTVTLQYTGGYSSQAGWSVTRSSTLSIGVEMSVTIGVPEVASASATTSISTDITNSVGSSFSTTTSSQTQHSIAVSAKAGQTCSVEFTVKDCNQASTGEVKYIASGFAWFNYNSPTKGHYKWAARIDSVLNEAERSSTAGFQGSVNGHSTSNYKATCKK